MEQGDRKWKAVNSLAVRLGKIDPVVNLIAGTDHTAPVKKIIANKSTQIIGDVVAQFELHLRHHREGIALRRANIGRLGEDSAREGAGGDPCPAKNRFAVDGNYLVGCAKATLPIKSTFSRPEVQDNWPPTWPP